MINAESVPERDACKIGIKYNDMRSFWFEGLTLIVSDLESKCDNFLQHFE